MCGLVNTTGMYYAKVPGEHLAEKIKLWGEGDVNGLSGINGGEVAYGECGSWPAVQTIVFDVVVGMPVMVPICVFRLFDPEGIA